MPTQMSDLLSKLREGRKPQTPEQPPQTPASVVITAKPPKVRDPTQSSILKLSNDIIVLILQAVQDCHPASIYNLRLVDSYFNHLAECLACSTLVLDLSGNEKAVAETKALLDHLVQQELLTAVRTIEAVNPYDLDPPMPGDPRQRKARPERSDLSRFRQLLPFMTGLKDIWWQNERLSRKTLKAIEQLPTVRLHAIFSADRQRYGLRGPLLEHLPGSANLYELSAQFTYTSAEECSEIMQRLKKVILTCSNLRALTFDVHLPRGGCCVYSLPEAYCGLGLIDGERPPALEKLVVNAYPFGTISPASQMDQLDHGFRRPFSKGYPGQKSEEEYWVDTFDWSRLKSLQVSNPDFAPLLMPKLSALEEISIKATSNPELVTRFYKEVPATLKKISVTTLRSVTLEGIVRHGHTLQELELHQQEGYQKPWSQDAIDNSSLAQIRAHCPNITDLRLDIARSGNWPYMTLDIIASFSKLQNLTIWFELGVCDDENLPQPPLTWSACCHLWEHLISHGATHLQTLHIYSGTPVPPGLGFPSPEAFWSTYNSAEFLVTRATRDDEAALGKFFCECPNLSADANQVLRGDQMDGLMEMEQTGIGSEALYVARFGPTPAGEWAAHY